MAYTKTDSGLFLLDNELYLPECVALPCADSKTLFGVAPTIYTPDDMISDISYAKLARGDPRLEEWEFVDKDMYFKYVFISLGLLDHPVIFVGGDPGGGKSLLMAWLTRKYYEYWGKNVTTDWGPPHPELYGHPHDLYDESFQEEIEKGFKHLSVLERRTHQPAPQAELEKFILYNAVLGLDECDTYADQQTQTNLTQFIARILRRRRHVHICAILVMIETGRFAKALKKQRTHEVECTWQGREANKSLIRIWDKRPNGTNMYRYLQLRPTDHLDLWNSHSISQVTHDVEIHFGNPKKKKKEEDE